VAKAARTLTRKRRGRKTRSAPIDTSKVIEPQDGSLLETYRAAVAAAIPAGIVVSETFWITLRERIGLFLKMRDRWLRTPAARKRWERIDKVVDELASEMRRERQNTSHEHANAYWPNRVLAGLQEAKAQSTAHLIYYRVAAEARNKGRDPNREYLFQTVIDLWVSLGQEVGYSTSGGSRSGPLVDFFKACLDPLLGDQPDETVRSIIRRRR